MSTATGVNHHAITVGAPAFANDDCREPEKAIASQRREISVRTLLCVIVCQLCNYLHRFHCCLRKQLHHPHSHPHYHYYCCCWHCLHCWRCACCCYFHCCCWQLPLHQHLHLRHCLPLQMARLLFDCCGVVDSSLHPLNTTQLCCVTNKVCVCLVQFDETFKTTKYTMFDSFVTPTAIPTRVLYSSLPAQLVLRVHC